jgi:hypothetical protein
MYLVGIGVHRSHGSSPDLLSPIDELKVALLKGSVCAVKSIFVERWSALAQCLSGSRQISARIQIWRCFILRQFMVVVGHLHMLLVGWYIYLLNMQVVYTQANLTPDISFNSASSILRRPRFYDRLNLLPRFDPPCTNHYHFVLLPIQERNLPSIIATIFHLYICMQSSESVRTCLLCFDPFIDQFRSGFSTWYVADGAVASIIKMGSKVNDVLGTHADAAGSVVVMHCTPGGGRQRRQVSPGCPAQRRQTIRQFPPSERLQHYLRLAERTYVLHIERGRRWDLCDQLGGMFRFDFFFQL